MDIEPSAHRDLDLAAALLSDISSAQRPQDMLEAYLRGSTRLLPMDRTIAVSRRDLPSPQYRITRSDLWPSQPDPWTQRDQLPLFESGLLGELLYAGKPRLIDPLVVRQDDPAAEHLQGMAALLAIPHFDKGNVLDMEIHLGRSPGRFDANRLPDLLLINGLFGRAMSNLVIVNNLQEAEAQLREQHLAVSRLSDTVLEQALALRSHAATLQQRVRERTADLEQAQLDAITMLAIATEEKDDDTGAHVRRIQQLTATTARSLGLSEEDADALGRASILHDIGKLHVPDAILQKPGPLTADERSTMETHTLVGDRILPPRSYFDTARRIARGHHENFDGTGYPDRAQGDRIPLEARIVRVVDVYDALTNSRPYKKAWTSTQALNFLVEHRGALFDPAIVQAFIASSEARPAQGE